MSTIQISSGVKRSKNETQSDQRADRLGGAPRRRHGSGCNGCSGGRAGEDVDTCSGGEEAEHPLHHG